MKKYSLLILILLAVGLLPAQEGAVKNWSVNGYVKNMQTLLFFNDAYPDFRQGALVDTFLQDNLVHNRLNFRWFPTSSLTFRAELRNRIFFGDLVKASPNYANQIDDVNNDYFDLSWVLYDGNSFVVHSMLDRLYLEYVSGDWEVRLGRQRINWGINLVWTPNDIFNSFNYFVYCKLRQD